MEKELSESIVTRHALFAVIIIYANTINQTLPLNQEMFAQDLDLKAFVITDNIFHAEKIKICES